MTSTLMAEGARRLRIEKLVDRLKNFMYHLFPFLLLTFVNRHKIHNFLYLNWWASLSPVCLVSSY